MNTTTKLLISIPLTLVAGFMCIGALTPDGTSRERAAIDLCWSDQARKSNDPTTARLIAGMCENMEREVAAKQ